MFVVFLCCVLLKLSKTSSPLSLSLKSKSKTKKKKEDLSLVHFFCKSPKTLPFYNSILLFLYFFSFVLPSSLSFSSNIKKIKKTKISPKKLLIIDHKKVMGVDGKGKEKEEMWPPTCPTWKKKRKVELKKIAVY